MKNKDKKEKKLGEEMIEDKKKEKIKKEKKSDNLPKADKRSKKLKLISLSSVVLFVAIAILFNIVFDTLLGSSLRWDWSQTEMFSIGDVSKEILSDMDKEVKIVGLYEEGTVSQFADIELLLEEYERYSNGMVTVRYVDPVRTPAILRELDPDEILRPSERNFVVRCEETDKAKVLTMSDLYAISHDQQFQQQITGVTAEQSFTGAIVFTTSEETPVVYMTQGHGEANYEQEYATMVSMMRNNNFLVKDLDLLTGNEIPDDAELLIMLDPTLDIGQSTKDIFSEYLRSGGSLLVITGFSGTEFPVLNSLLANYNIEITSNRIREGDRDRRFQEDPYVFFADAPPSFISEENVGRLTFVRNVREISEVRNIREWIEVNPVFNTGNQGVVEIDGDPENTGSPGIKHIGLATENKGFMDGVNVTSPARVMVIGSKDFMHENILQVFGTQVYNIYSFYYAMNWLVDVEEDGLLIAPKQLPSYRLTRGSNTSFWATTIITVIVIPLGLLIVALIVYRKRKNM